jgi:F0F1-type ATP synthase membrane subunit c/vacuolar-type H+-ATPase subunit K
MKTTFDIDKMYRKQLVLWGALFFSVGLYFVLGLLAVPNSTSELTASDRTLAVVFSILSISVIIASLLMKRMLLRQSVAKQIPGLVQSAMIVGMALCESVALFGLLLRFVTHFDKFYWLFILAAVAMTLHFPRRANLMNATFKASGESGF